MGEEYLYTVQAASGNGGAILYRLSFGPAGMRVSREGALTWTPTRQGLYMVEVKASLMDNPAVSQTQRWGINVSLSSGTPSSIDLAPCGDNETWVPMDEGLPHQGVASLVNENGLYVIRREPANIGLPDYVVSLWNGNFWSDVTRFEAGQPPKDFIEYDGALYICGYFKGLSDPPTSNSGLARWDGTEWEVVETGALNGGVLAMEVYNDELYVAGSLNYLAGDSRHAVRKWDGTEWTQVGELEGLIYDLLAFDGKLYCAGIFTSIDGVEAKGVAVWDGSEWSAVGDRDLSPSEGLVVYEDDLFLIRPTGNYPVPRSELLMKWDGTEWTGVETILKGVLFEPKAISYGGELYLAGTHVDSSAADPEKQWQSVILRWDGTEWYPVSRLNREVSSFSLYEGGLYAVGPFTESCNGEVNHVARLCNEESCGRISGSVFHDGNGNCGQNGGEKWMRERVIEVQPGPYYTTTNGKGEYGFWIPTGTYTVDVAPVAYWNRTCPDDAPTVILSSAGSKADNVDFALQSTPGIYDIRASVMNGIARPGRDISYTVLCRNVGTEPASGSLAFTYDDRLDLRAATATPDRQNGNILEWDFTRLDVGEDLVITVTLNIPTTIQRGETLCAFAEANFEKRDDDRLLSDNLDSSCTEVRTSYDPNDIRVTPHRELGELGYETLLPNDSVLTYMVRFQNTGNDTAFRVVVRDTLGVDLLEVASIELGASSHGYEFSISGHGELEWRFENILLPDSGASEVGSHGYFKYRVRLKRGLGPLTEIANRASIYFDYNEPVMTNTVVSVTSGTSSVAEESVAESLLRVYPNPARDRSMIGLQLDKASSVHLSLIDAKGVEVRRLLETNLAAGEHHVELDVRGLPSGAYFLLLDRDGKRESRPIVIGR